MAHWEQLLIPVWHLRNGESRKDPLGGECDGGVAGWEQLERERCQEDVRFHAAEAVAHQNAAVDAAFVRDVLRWGEGLRAAPILARKKAITSGDVLIITAVVSAIGGRASECATGTWVPGVGEREAQKVAMGHFGLGAKPGDHTVADLVLIRVVVAGWTSHHGCCLVGCVGWLMMMCPGRRLLLLLHAKDGGFLPRGESGARGGAPAKPLDRGNNTAASG